MVFPTFYGIFLFLWEGTFEFIRNFLKFLPGIGPAECKSNKKLDGKVAIITGSNGGIGKETALQMAKRGCRVIMACRDLKKASQAEDEIRELWPPADVQVEKLDLSSLESVKQFAMKMNRREDKIDYLINNAGVMMCPKWTTKDGFEMQFGTNHLGHFLLTLLLSEKLRKAPAARVVNVSSIAHYVGTINYDDINHDKDYIRLFVYGQSKLANILFTKELAKRMKDTNVKTYALHPGFINSDLYQHVTGLLGVLDRLILNRFKMNIHSGAQTTLFCALDDSIENESGEYYANCKKTKVLPLAENEEAARKLWELSCELVKIKDLIEVANGNKTSNDSEKKRVVNGESDILVIGDDNNV